MKSLSLTGFRNYARLELPMGPGFHVIAGPNAQGKTNLLEALHLVGTGRLLRGRRDQEAILETREEAEAAVETEGGQRLAVRLTRGGRKRAFLSSLPLPRTADLLGRLPVVVVSAEDLSLVRGEPADRRLWLDLELSALSPGYLRHLSVYKRALEQRNAVLKAARESGRGIDDVAISPWEDALAQHGMALRAARTEYLNRLTGPAVAFHAHLGGGEALEIAPRFADPHTTTETALTALRDGRYADMSRGATQTGPHRDDIAILVGGREARLFGSQGQQRTAVIAVKMATLESAREDRGHPPLLLLDDILSDLDERRRAALVELVVDRAEQAVLTCTEARAAGERILERAQVYDVHAGCVTPHTQDVESVV